RLAGCNLGHAQFYLRKVVDTDFRLRLLLDDFRLLRFGRLFWSTLRSRGHRIDDVLDFLIGIKSWEDRLPFAQLRSSRNQAERFRALPGGELSWFNAQLCPDFCRSLGQKRLQQDGSDAQGFR